MKTVILYDTKYGFTQEVAEFINNHIEDASLFHINDPVDLSEYELIYLGSYIMKSEMSKNTLLFIKANKPLLMRKKLKIFCSALDTSDFNHALQTSLDPEIFYRSKKINAGGRVEYKKLNFIEKRLLKSRINITGDTYVFNEQAILDLIKDNKW